MEAVKVSTPDEQCYLLNLPAELRNQIYEYILVDKNYIDLDGYRGSSVSNPYHCNSTWPLSAQILRTNKAIHKEATGVLYSQNIFDLTGNFFEKDLLKFCDLIGPVNSALIRQVRIVCPDLIGPYPEGMMFDEWTKFVIDLLEERCSNLKILMLDFYHFNGMKELPKNRSDAQEVKEELAFVNTQLRAISNGRSRAEKEQEKKEDGNQEQEQSPSRDGRRSPLSIVVEIYKEERVGASMKELMESFGWIIIKSPRHGA